MTGQNPGSTGSLMARISACERTRCGNCLAECPTFRISPQEARSPRGKMVIAKALSRGTLKYSTRLSDALNFCTMCGYCSEHCQLDPTNVTVALRANLVAAGFENSNHRQGIDSIFSSGNPYLLSKDRRDIARINTRTHATITESKISKKSETLLYAGCTYAYFRPKQLSSISDLLAEAGIQTSYLGREEVCCGQLMHTTGHWEEFERIVRINKNLFAKTHAKTLITLCPGCLKTFATLYSESPPHFEIEVKHITQILPELIDHGKLQPKNRIDMDVTFHDPCDLGRGMGMFDEPRRVLENIPGIKLIEMRRNRNNSGCCGAGGGMLAAHTTQSLQIAIGRVKEAEETGARTIVTSCPTCERMLRTAILHMKSSIGLTDLGALLGMSINQ